VKPKVSRARWGAVARSVVSCGIVATLCAACRSAPDKPVRVARDARSASLRVIEGRVFWPDSLDRTTPGYRGTPLGGLEVGCYRLGDRMRLFATVPTDAEGRFRLEGLVLHTGDRFALVASYRDRRFCLGEVRRVKVAQRGGPDLASWDRSEWFNIFDTTSPHGGFYKSHAFRIKARGVEGVTWLRYNEATGKKERAPARSIGAIAKKTLGGVELFALPLVPRGERHWSDGAAPEIQVKGAKDRALDVLVRSLPATLEEGLARRLDETYLLSPRLRSWSQGALARTGLRRCDLTTLADGMPFELPAGGTFADRRLEGTRGRLLDGEEAVEGSPLEGRRIALSPGHGFFIRAGRSGLEPAHWVSPRSFVSRSRFSKLTRPGILEDDLSVGVGRELLAMLEARGAEVVSFRELRDMTREGVSHPSDGRFEPWSGDASADLPRLWEQSAKYYAGRVFPEQVARWTDARSPGSKEALPAMHPADRRVDDNSKSLRARVRLFRDLAERDAVDCLVALHTNARGSGAPQSARRGPLALYLDVDAEATPEGATRREGNRLGVALGEALLAGLTERAWTSSDRLLSMKALGRGVAMLRDTYPYAYRVPEDNSKNRSALFERRRAGGEESFTSRVAGAVEAEDQGWFLNPFPKALGVSLIELGYHDHPEDVALLQHRWYHRALARGLVAGLERYFAGLADGRAPEVENAPR
jgi:hypothetical protein